jgi:hypothetical protein
MDGWNKGSGEACARRDGRPETTPVWAAALGGRLYVFTGGSTGKAKRVHATDRARVAPSSMNGRRLLGEWREATRRLIGDAALRDRAMAALELPRDDEGVDHGATRNPHTLRNARLYIGVKQLFPAFGNGSRRCDKSN